jgi:hypothetical protein
VDASKKQDNADGSKEQADADESKEQDANDESKVQDDFDKSEEQAGANESEEQTDADESEERAELVESEEQEVLVASDEQEGSDEDEPKTEVSNNAEDVDADKVSKKMEVGTKILCSGTLRQGTGQARMPWWINCYNRKILMQKALDQALFGSL